MPSSARENDHFVKSFVKRQGIQTVLDVGAGCGTYADMLGSTCTLDAVEAWEPYVNRFGLASKYRHLYTADVRGMAGAHLAQERLIPGSTSRQKVYDLVVFGDVMEHMAHEDALEVWEWASRISHWGLISVPLVHWPQGAEEGNPYEVHVQEHLHADDIEQHFGPFLLVQTYALTGTFIRRFE